MCSRIDSYIKQFFLSKGRFNISQWMLKIYYVYIITGGFQVNGNIMYINFTKQIHILLNFITFPISFVVTKVQLHYCYIK